jgi:hypothetical protein
MDGLEQKIADLRARIAVARSRLSSGDESIEATSIQRIHIPQDTYPTPTPVVTAQQPVNTEKVVDTAAVAKAAEMNALRAKLKAKK